MIEDLRQDWVGKYIERDETNPRRVHRCSPIGTLTIRGHYGVPPDESRGGVRYSFPGFDPAPVVCCILGAFLRQMLMKKLVQL